MYPFQLRPLMFSKYFRPHMLPAFLWKLRHNAVGKSNFLCRLRCPLFSKQWMSKILKLKLCLWSFTETSPSHKKSALVFRFTKKQPFETSHTILHVAKPFGQILDVKHLAVLKLLFLKVLMLLPNKLYGL